MSIADHHPNTTVSRDDDEIRARLLNTLGIRKEADDRMGERVLGGTSSSAATAVVSLLEQEGPQKRMSLNDSAEHRSSNNDNKGLLPKRRSSRKRVVKFDTDVLVQPIPSHRQFSKRIKRTLWTNREELQDMAHRNTVEYQAEGWDPSRVLEDDDMYVDATTLEKVHPYWVEEDTSSLLVDPSNTDLV